RGLTESLENHHKVRILDEAVEDAVRLSHRYISGRQLPDKSVSVLDTACAKVAIGQAATPAPIEDAQRRIEHLGVEIGVLEREAITGQNHQERIDELRAAKASEEERLSQLKLQWDKEAAAIGRIRDIRAQLEAHVAAKGATHGDGAAQVAKAASASAGDGSPGGTTIDVQGLRGDLDRLNKEL